MHERLGFALQGVPLCSWSLFVRNCNKYNTTENKNPDSLCFVGVWVQGAITGHLIIILLQEIWRRVAETPPPHPLCICVYVLHIHISVCMCPCVLPVCILGLYVRAWLH